jgi:hypothetical protein
MVSQAGARRLGLFTSSLIGPLEKGHDLDEVPSSAEQSLEERYGVRVLSPILRTAVHVAQGQ